MNLSTKNLEEKVTKFICNEVFGDWEATGYEIKASIQDGVRLAVDQIAGWMIEDRDQKPNNILRELMEDAQDLNPDY